jgi:SAM-dependent methyltransferase
MHPRVFREFERICSSKGITGSVLEVGATPSADCLLNMNSLAGAVEKIGVNLEGPHDFNGFRILRGNANYMDMFEDGRFDAVLCNAVLEHDKFFWKTVAEIKRVTKPGGWVVIGVPGYGRLKGEAYKSVIKRIPLVRSLRSHQYLGGFFNSTVTFQVHNHPGDFYRFGRQAMSDVLLEGLEEVEIHSIMLPPRFIGAGRKSGCKGGL